MSKKNHTRELEPKDAWVTDRKRPGEQPELKEIGVVSANQSADYLIHEDEVGMYHLAMKKVVNNARAKRYEDDWHYQAYYPQEYNTMLDSGFFDQYDTVDILHDPTLNGKLTKDKQGSNGSTPPIKPGSTLNGGVTNPGMNAGDVDDDDTNAGGTAFVPYKSLYHAQQRYLKEYGTNADDNATLEQLNELLAGKLNQSQD